MKVLSSLAHDMYQTVPFFTHKGKEIGLNGYQVAAAMTLLIMGYILS